MNETPKSSKTRSYKKRAKPLLTFTSTVPVRKRDKDAAHLIGYVRVSMNDQNNQRQVDELAKFGVNPIDVFGDKASGKNMERPGWKACMRELQEGDWLVVWSIDRLGRNLEEVIRVEKQLRDKGVTLKALAQDINTSTAAGRLIFHILLTVAQFEREWSNERSLHGLQKARERGTLGGRRITYTDKQIIDAMMKAKGNYERAAKYCKEPGAKESAKKITMIRRWKKIIEKKPSLAKAVRQGQKVGADAIR
jgi:DNA invertase Pin-like site-specific DNA recombinase